MKAKSETLPPFSFCPRCGAAGFAPAGRRFFCAACDFEFFANVAVAVAAFVLDARENVLLIRRKKSPGRGRLAPPGGFVDPDETAAEALRRELLEETGLKVSRPKFLCSQPNGYRRGGVTYPVLDLFFVARVASFDAARALDEVDELVMVPRARVRGEELAFPSMRAAWRQFCAERKAGSPRRH